MKIQSHFQRIAALTIASLILIIAVAALRSVCANTFWGESEVERFVLHQVQQGEIASLDRFPQDQRKLSASFIAELLTSRKASLKTPPYGVMIMYAVITGDLDLTDQEIPYPVNLDNCTFEGDVDFTRSRFAGSLYLTNSNFKMPVDFSGTTVGVNLILNFSKFASESVTFQGMRVGRDFLIYASTFDTVGTAFNGAMVAGSFNADESRFNSASVSFDDMRVDGSFSARHCTFRGMKPPEYESITRVGFAGAHFTDFFLNDSTFDKIATIDFTRLQADLISIDGVESKSPSEVKTQRLTFKRVSPSNALQLRFLLSSYDTEFYTNLEATLRTHGYPDEADSIFIAKKRAERRENCKDFLGQCHRGAWAWSIFQDMLAGYGKRLQNLLYWSLGFLLIGTFVFRSEKGMRTKDRKDARHYYGRYQAFWYSLDLFLPIIKLGEADIWTPKDDRRWANLYRRVHIIIGSLFVPIGLAAWTGIIK